MPADELDVLLIEDNPGDARLIEEMFANAEELLRRVDVDHPSDAGARLHHERRLRDGLEHVAQEGADVVLLDLGLPESTGLETLATVLEEVTFVPVVVLTGLRDESVGIEAIQRGAQDYLVKEEVTGDLLVRSIHHAIERNRQERRRARQLEQLTALNRLNEISNDVTHAVITTSTREELERAVCERFVRAEDYRLAWIGDVDRPADRITPRVAVGADEGYLDEITVPVGDDETDRGPAGRAVDTREVQVVENVRSDPSFEPWREQAIERGFRSGIAVPIVHESLLYGVLCLYATSPTAFDEPEVEILSRLGEVIGHAITAIERRDALVSDTVLELEFEVTGVGEELVSLTAEREATIEIGTVVRTDDTLVAFGTTDGVAPADLQEAVDGTAVESFRYLEPEGGADRFEVVTRTGHAMADAVATRGGFVASATIADGEFRFVVQFPPGRDRRQLVDLVTEHCPGATPHAQRTVEQRDRDATDFPAVLQGELTDKQRSALEVAFHGGYFDWPRASSSQDVADRLGVTAATFTRHLRAAERKFFDELFATTAEEHHPESPWSSIEAEQDDR